MNPRETRPLRLQLRQHGDRLVDRHREPDAARSRADGRVDPDHLAARVDERPAAVAEIDGRVRLDVVVEARVEQLAPDEADDADRDRVHVAERVADGADPFADPQIVGVAERRPAGESGGPSTWRSATSMAGSAPTTSARSVRPSASVTVIRCGGLDHVVVREDEAGRGR